MSEEFKSMRSCSECGEHPEVDSETGLCEACGQKARFEEAVGQRMNEAHDAVRGLYKCAWDEAGQEALRRILRHEHRTNQQLACKSIISLLGELAKMAKKGDTDARNEAAANFGMAVFDRVPERLRYLPYI